MTVGLLVLAAGRSRRFGGDKRFALLNDGRALLHTTLNSAVASGLPVRVCLRDEEDEFSDQLLELGIDRIILCPRSDKGIGYSLANGVSHCYDWDGLLVVLGDMPFVESSTYSRLAAALSKNNICVPVYGDASGNPVAFGSNFFSSLEKLDDDFGAKDIVQSNRQAVIKISTPDKGILMDIDVPGDIVSTNFSY